MCLELKNNMEHYHDYKIINSTDSGQVERCVECGHRLIVTKDKRGRIDNAAYLKSHARDFAQATGSTSKIFNRFYNKKK